VELLLALFAETPGRVVVAVMSSDAQMRCRSLPMHIRFPMHWVGKTGGDALVINGATSFH
jgi:hypothetical protein